MQVDNQPSILIVDDDTALLRTWEMILTRKNYRVFTAPDGATALALAHQHALNLAIVDIRLPDMSGNEVLAQLKTLRPDIEIVILTGNATLESAVQALANGAYRYVIKPVNPDELLATLEQALHKQRLVIENRHLLSSLQSIFRAAPVGIGVLVNRVLVQVNERICEMTGYTREELIGQSARILYPTQEDFEYVGTVKYQQIHEHGIGTVETRWQRKDGTVLDILLSSVPLNPQDWSQGITFTALDITARKRAEAALQAERDFAQNVLNALGQGVTVLNRDGVFEYVNPAYARMVGRSPDELIGKRPTDVTAPEDHALLAEQRAKRWQGETSTYETRLVHADGHLVPVTITGVPRWANGQFAGAIAVITDLTERYQREREMQAIATISAALRAATTREEMLPIIVENTMQLLNAQAAAIISRRTVNHEAFIECARGVWAKGEGRRTPPGKGLSALIFKTKQPYVTNDMANDPNIFWKDWGEEVCALASVPLIVAQDQVIGTLGIGRNTPITPDEVRVLVAIADIAANALHRATLHEQTEQRLQHLLALQAINQAINASLDLRVILDILIDQVKNQLRVDAVAVSLCHPHTPILTYTVGRGFRNPIEHLTVRIGEGYAGRVAREQRTLALGHFIAEHAPHFANEGFVAYCGVPLIAKGQLVGVLEVFQRAPASTDTEWIHLLETMALQAALAINNARLYEELQRTNARLELSYDTTIESWARALELRGHESAGHTQRVAALTERFARALGIQDARLTHIRYGALLHDVGKLALPDAALHPDDPLREDDATLCRHPELARDLLQPIPYLQPALDIPYCHHEKWNGSGYPRGLKGEEIPLAARLFAIVDTWDTLRHTPPYNTTWSESQVREYIRSQAGKAFDPNLVETFLKLV